MKGDIPFDAEGQKENVVLYIFLGVYLLCVAGVGYVAFRRKRRAASLGAVEAQYSGDFHPFFIVLSTFATVFSGFTIMGVPEDGARFGYFAIRGIPGILACAFGMLLFYPRLRRLGVLRKYRSPNEFIADRYRSQLLTVLASLCTCLPQLFYLSVQLIAFAELLNGLTLGAVPKLAGMFIFSVIVLTMEKVGGMNSVVLSDVVQGLVMMFGFLAIAGVVAAHYGTLGELTPMTCPSLGYVNQTHRSLLIELQRYEEAPMKCTSPPPPESVECVAFGCISAARPDFFEVPNSVLQGSYFWLVFNFVAFGLNPHMVQRSFIASSDDTLRFVIASVVIASFAAILPGLAMGIVAATFSPSWPASSAMAATFAGMGSELKRFGVFEYGLVTMLYCSVLAAIMSTADSVILGVSNALSVDVFEGILRPDASPDSVVNFGMAVSVVMTSFALIMGANLDSSALFQLLILQNGILLQICPAFLLGLYSDISPQALASGILGGLVVLALSMSVFANMSFFVELTTYFPSPNMSAVVNLLITFGTECLMRSRGDVGKGEASGRYSQALERRFRERLTIEQIRANMQGDVEPNRALMAITAVTICLATPLYAEHLDSIGLIGGLPPWVVVVFAFCVLALVLLLALVWLWRPSTANGAQVQAAALTASAHHDKGLEPQVVGKIVDLAAMADTSILADHLKDLEQLKLVTPIAKPATKQRKPGITWGPLNVEFETFHSCVPGPQNVAEREEARPAPRRFHFACCLFGPP